MRRTTLLFIVALTLGLLLGSLASPAPAQTKPINPRNLYFTVIQADYDLAVKFEVGWFLIGAAAPVSPPSDLGKPPLQSTDCAPGMPTPCAHVTVNTMVLPFGMNYVARVREVALNAEGVTVYSEWSDEGADAFFERKPGKPGVVIK